MNNPCLRFTAALGVSVLLVVSVSADGDQWQVLFNGKDGHVGLQNHKTPIQFRNIRIRPVTPMR